MSSTLKRSIIIALIACLIGVIGTGIAWFSELIDMTLVKVLIFLNVMFLILNVGLSYFFDQSKDDEKKTTAMTLISVGVYPFYVIVLVALAFKEFQPEKVSFILSAMLMYALHKIAFVRIIQLLK